MYISMQKHNIYQNPIAILNNSIVDPNIEFAIQLKNRNLKPIKMMVATKPPNYIQPIF